MSGTVTIVVYGEELHAHGDMESATILYTVAVGANMDAEMHTVTEERFGKVRADLAEQGIEVIDHR